MTTYDLKTAGRQYRRQFDTAIRGNLIRALTELITNSDDSYRRLEHDGHDVTGRIYIDYNRGQRIISVIDDGEGLTDEEMRLKFTEYGAATSGLKEDRSVRGYFGKGIKDVLFGMEKGRVKSIKDGIFYSANFIWGRGGKPQIKINRPQRATRVMRTSLDIRNNGTRVEFEIPEESRLSRHETILDSLANFYMLRMINSNDNRIVQLKTTNANGTTYEERVRYSFPVGVRLLDDNFVVEYSDYSFPIILQISRANTPLTQTGEDREGGLLITDDEGTVLDLTLFKFDQDEIAARLFGLISIPSFRSLLADEELVLSDTRDGLNLFHPFCQELVAQVEQRLEPIIEAERQRQRESRRQLSKRQRQRLD